MAKNTRQKHTAPPTVDGRRTRTPVGVDKRPIALRLMPDERAQVEAEAEERGVTMAAFSRQCFVSGLAAICQARPAQRRSGQRRAHRSPKP